MLKQKIAKEIKIVKYMGLSHYRNFNGFNTKYNGFHYNAIMNRDAHKCKIK